MVTGTLPSCPTCQAPDMCTGTNVVCNDGLPCSEDTCNPATGNCDHPPKPANTLCRASAGSCDVEERCDGIDLDCPADELLPSATACRAVQGPCDVAETCSGSSPDCPTNDFLPSTQVCRPAVDPCDETELCTGNGPNCPNDQQINCDDGEFCTLDSCDPGVPGLCVHDAQAMEFTACNNSDACTGLDQCHDGTCSWTRPIICFPTSEQCRVNECDSALGCVTVFTPGPCDDGNVCTVGEACDENTGECTAPLFLNCDDFDSCTADSCDPVTGCVSEEIPCEQLPVWQRLRCKHCISRSN